MELRSSFTAGERLLSAIGLTIAAVGLVNLFIWERSLLGLDSRQLSIILFLPSALILYYQLERLDPRNSK
jgi:hypothetical protein